MKTIKKPLIIFFLKLFLISSSSLSAQDPLKVAPDNYKRVVIDNDKVRVMDFELAAGQSIPWHSHPNHVIYALTSGKLSITDKGKKENIFEVNAGDAMYIPAVTHMAKNLGTNTIKLVVTEIKPTYSVEVNQLPAQAKKKIR